MDYKMYKRAAEIMKDGAICKEIIGFVDTCLPPNGSGYDISIVLHDKAYPIPQWLYESIREICEKKRESLKKEFAEL